MADAELDARLKRMSTARLRRFAWSMFERAHDLRLVQAQRDEHWRYYLQSKDELERRLGEPVLEARQG